MTTVNLGASFEKLKIGLNMKHSKLKKDIEAAIERQNTRQPLALPKEKYVAPFYQQKPVIAYQGRSGNLIDVPAEKVKEVEQLYVPNKVILSKQNSPGRNKNM